MSWQKTKGHSKVKRSDNSKEVSKYLGVSAKKHMLNPSVHEFPF